MKMSYIMQRVVFMAMSACHTSYCTDDFRNDRDADATSTGIGGLRFETVSQAGAPPPPTLHPQWLPQEDATRSFLNDSWLDWSSWNLTESDWLEWDVEEQSVSLFWIGCMIPVPVILALLYVIYLYMSKIRREQSTRRSGVLCRLWCTVSGAKRYTCCKNNNRDSYCESLCDRDALTSSADFYQLSNETARASATDIEAAYSMDTGVQLPHIKLLKSSANATVTDCTVKYQNIQDSDDSVS